MMMIKPAFLTCFVLKNKGRVEPSRPDLMIGGRVKKKAKLHFSRPSERFDRMSGIKYQYDSIVSAGTLFFVGRIFPSLQIDGVFINGAGSPIILDFFGEVGEGLFHVASAFGTDLQKQHIVFFRHFFCLFGLHLPLIFQIAFGTNQYFADRFAGVSLDLLDPPSNVLETLFIIDGKGQDDSGSPFVVSLSNVSEALLTGSVPNLEFDFGVIDVDGFEFEVNPDGGHVAVLEDSIAELGEEVGFADSAVTDDDDFGQEVVFG